MQNSNALQLMKTSNALVIAIPPRRRPLRWDRVVIERYLRELARGLA